MKPVATAVSIASRFGRLCLRRSTIMQAFDEYQLAVASFPDRRDIFRLGRFTCSQRLIPGSSRMRMARTVTRRIADARASFLN